MSEYMYLLFNLSNEYNTGFCFQNTILLYQLEIGFQKFPNLSRLVR
jgi:hypothetical protein